MDNNETVTKIAFASALFAGFAYFSLSILRDTFKSDKKGHKDEKKLMKANIGSQTELTFPIGKREKVSAWAKVPPELWTPWAKSIRERIRELNLCRLVNSNGIYEHKPITSGLKTVSQYNSPRHTPRSLSPDPSFVNRNLSRSEENLSMSRKPKASSLNKKQLSSRSNLGINKVLKVPTDTEIKMYAEIMNRIKTQSCSQISQHEASVLTMLLMSGDCEILVKTLSVVANCAAFTVNVDPICDCGCLLIMEELLDHPNNAVQAAATQALANLAMSERVQEFARPLIPNLIANLMSSRNDLHLIWTLMALANMAMKDDNHETMICCLSVLMDLLANGSSSVRIQTVKLLVNLSCNAQLVPYLLATKQPSNMYILIDERTDGDLLLRFLSFLANVIDVSTKKAIKPEHLPPDHKAPSPETVYSAIFGYNNAELLIRRLNNLTNIQHEDIKAKVTQILSKLQNSIQI